MATAAISPLASSVEKTNGAKLSRLLIDGGTSVLRKVFDSHHPPANLVADLNANFAILNILFKKKVLRKPQWEKLFPPGGAAPDSNTFDITLLFLLLTNICGLSPPLSGWHAKLPSGDTSHEANLARVKLYRNVLYGHVTSTGVDTPTFSALWLEISAVLVALGLDQAEVDRLKAEKGGEQDYLDALLEWADSKEDIKSQLKNIHQSQTKTLQAAEEVLRTQTKTRQTVEEVLQTQTKTQQTVEEVFQTQTKTQQTVEEVLQTQTKTQQTVEEVFQTQTKTQQTVEEVLQTQTKTQQTVEEVYQTVEEVFQTQTKTQQTVEQVKEAVDSLKEGRDKERADEVLRNLAKSEFRGDIEYYVKRFQDDTREWVFDRVQNWLDDRSSQNRAMVISAKAGMGKSVIAAVVCKRMQEAGRLSGSHFCQYNNARYCKPQLMLQSLACHLSYALPEYKQALVEQLSRNLGKDLNNMGVEELFSLLFKEPLSLVGDPGRNLLMVIDGLDESEYQGRNELLDVIANQFCKLPSWIRFLMTTRPAMNITEKLKHLKPFELQSNDEKNVQDIRTFLENNLQHVHVIKAENEDDLVGKLVLKSEGLMLYAHFLILFINENPSVLNQKDLDGSLPLGISSVYHSYFKRAESELMKELDIKEEHFLNLLCALTASREPLPVGFVSKVLVPGTNSPVTKRKVLKALGSVSALLPIRDGCLHIIHKSVKDWLTDISCYGEHEFIMDENEGHHVLADLCSGELDDLKRRGINNEQFSATEKYALYHGARHMLHSDVERRPDALDELTKVYVIDLELVYAKTCINGTTAAEDIVFLQKQGIYTVLSEECQVILDTLLFLLRKYLKIFSNSPRMFLQTMLNQGGTVLSAEASNLLKNKYREISYMEYTAKDVQQGGVVAQFQCSSRVACLDVSPELDYMVCECIDGMLQLWSLHTGRLMWTRPVKVTKKYVTDHDERKMGYRQLHSSPDLSYYRSVVFNPTEDVVLPGILSHAYTIDGDLKPLFLKSNCRFSVCSIAGDKTKILTDCLDNPKCLVMWSLKDGSEIARVTRNEDILSFAWSRDGRLLAISHSNGLICLVDVMDGFKTLAQTSTSHVCGMLKFSPDHQFLFCLVFPGPSAVRYSLICLNVNTKNLSSFSLDVCSDQVSYDYREYESISDCGFLLGDLIPHIHAYHRTAYPAIHFLLNEQTQLRVHVFSNKITMLNTNEVRKNSQDRAVLAGKIALALDGQTVYVINVKTVSTVMAWDASSGELIAEINNGTARTRCLVPVRGGVLFTSDGTPELWKCDLSECVQRWTNLSGITKVIPISEERAACIEKVEVKFLDTSRELVTVLDTTSSKTVNVLDTTSGKIVSTIPVLHGKVIACNSKCQLLTSDDDGSLQLSDGTTVLWLKHLSRFNWYNSGVFSPVEQFLCVLNDTCSNMLFLDALSGNTLHAFSSINIGCCEFVSDEEYVFFNYDSLQLFNVRSGDLLSEIIVERSVLSLAVCSRNRRLLAIGVLGSTPFKVIQVRCGVVKTTGRAKGMNKAPEVAEQSRK